MSATDSRPVEDVTGIRKRFRTLLEIGRGGMAQVFLAESVSFDVRKLVVLKVLNNELAAYPEMRAAFRREADITARMNHPNVVQVFEVVEHAGQTIIVMEYLEGLPLSRVMRHTRLPLALHMDVLSQVLGGLHHFHELRDLDDSPLDAVHRDISPQNVVLLHDGVAKVLDFGVAKFTAGDPERTRSGLVKGKIQYMPPEQLLGDSGVDRRADIFAVGVMMWEALAARRLWNGAPERDVMRALARGEIPALRDVNPDVPAELEEIVNQALQPEAELRFQTAKDMQTALEQAMPATVGLVHSRDLALFMHEHFGDARKAQKAKLDSARRNPSADIVLDAYRPPSLSDATIVEPAPAAAISDAPASATELAPPLATYAATKRRLMRFLPGLVFGLGACGLAFGLYSARSPKQSPVLQQLAPVQFHVLTDPADAEIWLDGKLIATGMHQGTQKSSRQEHRLAIRAAGYLPKEESIHFDSDVVRLIRLVPIQSPAASSSATGTLRAVLGVAPEKPRPAGPLSAILKSTEALEHPTASPSALTPEQQQGGASGTLVAPPSPDVEAPKTTSSVSSLPTAQTKEAPQRAKQVSPKLGHSRLAVDVSTDPYRIRLPPAFNGMAGTLETLVRICVAASGSVSSVSIVRSADPALDQRVTSTIPRWRYTPMLEDSRAIPFCYTVNLRF
jgi:serine/threonine-protein kinase